MSNPLDTLTPAELRTELGAAVLTLAEQATTIERLREALARIERAEGPYSTDRETHAMNCIESMAAIAQKALEKETK